MSKYVRIPNNIFVTRDLDAAEEVIDALKANIDVAIKSGDAKAAMAYSVVLSTISTVLDDLETAACRLDEIGGLLDLQEAEAEVAEAA